MQADAPVGRKRKRPLRKDGAFLSANVFWAMLDGQFRR